MTSFKIILLPFLIIFLVIFLLLKMFAPELEAYHFDVSFIRAAHIIIFLLTLLGMWIQLRASKSTNINAFLRGIYTSLLMKMFVLVGAIFIYISVAGGTINQNAILTCFGIYVIYTAAEVILLLKIIRKKTNV